MLSAEDNERLTRIGEGTPMGTLLRRFWLPVLLASELPEPDGPPVRVRVLGRCLVAFRDSAGQVGLVDPRCPHRGADLFFGRNEEGGIRCVFHGWKFDTDGRCLDAPTMPPERCAQILPRIRLSAFPVREAGDLIWGYFGPPGYEPAFPLLEFTRVPAAHRFMTKRLQECNWAQIMEGSVDTAHFSFLHAPLTRSDEEERSVVATMTRGYSTSSLNQDRIRWMRNDGRPQFQILQHEGGLVLGASRKADGEDLYWRITQYLLPTHVFAPSTVAGETYHGLSYTPIDDRSCWVYSYSWNPDRPLTDEERASYAAGAALHAKVDAAWIPLRNRHNDYQIDRVQQKHSTYTGITGIAEQDACIQESQGPILDRSNEHLGPTDAGVVRWRRLMFDMLRDLENGTEPAAATHPESYCVRSGGHVADASKSLQQVMLERFGDPLGRTDRGGVPTAGEQAAAAVPASGVSQT
ncbi:MAG: Rieske 2Fe-2S domain-containing protein [Lautropia sp.]